MTHRVRVLIAKDLRLHGRSIVFVSLALCAVCTAAFRYRPSTAGSDLILVVNLNGLVVLLWAEWFINREKTKQTFAWLRTLPLSTTELCVSKFTMASGCTILLWALTSLLFLREEFLALGWATWCVILAALLLFSALTVACRWRFPYKLGQVLPAVLVLSFLFAVLAAIRWEVTRDLVLRLGTTTGGQLGLSVALLAAYLAIYWLTWRWVTTTETRQMLE